MVGAAVGGAPAVHGDDRRLRPRSGAEGPGRHLDPLSHRTCPDDDDFGAGPRRTGGAVWAGMGVRRIDLRLHACGRRRHPARRRCRVVHRAALVRRREKGLLRVAVARAFTEPLSPAGVKKALLSAWRAAVVANTTMSHPSRASAARDLYTQREREVHVQSMRRAGAFFAEAATAYATPFWSARAERTSQIAGAAHANAAVDWSDEALARDAGVRAAFEYLRADEHVRLRISDTLRFAPVAAIEGREVVLRDGVVLPGAGPVPFAAGVDLAALARLARGGCDVPALIAAYHCEVGRVPLTGLLTGLSLLVAHRALVAEGSSS